MASGVQVWGSIETHIPLLHICCMDFGPRDQYRHTAVTRSGETQAASRPRIIARLIADGLSLDLQWDTGHGNKGTPLSVAAQHLNAPAVKALLDAGADVRIRDARGKNVVMAAVARDLTPHRVWELVPRGWDIEKDNVSRALLVFQLLLDAGIPINDPDPSGNTVLHLFFAYPIRLGASALQEELRMLLAKGAGPRIRNKDGVSAFQVAVRHRCFLPWKYYRATTTLACSAVSPPTISSRPISRRLLREE
ncbi:putative ankyrin repeat protein L93 [Madurella mycetomatis]|uniref:Putative ankyrin repeat protein L93 n=1 Tax=Madurella mycetomatis TaxID=100816 RepID=A0A175WA95_9PEZI|nr:putative ankyrin repeat protein L93 [Madurella mycetomatis]KXX82440.1 putative ankyrin repeat protein L93 [Madurella mycetomatis]